MCPNAAFPPNTFGASGLHANSVVDVGQGVSGSAAACLAWCVLKLYELLQLDTARQLIRETPLCDPVTYFPTRWFPE